MIFFCNVTIQYQNNNDKRNNFQIVITLQLSIFKTCVMCGVVSVIFASIYHDLPTDSAINNWLLAIQVPN